MTRKEALIAEHQRTMELIIAKYKVKDDLKDDVYNSMVVALLEADAEYGENYEKVLLDKLCEAVEECVRCMSYQKKITIQDENYELAYDELDIICAAYSVRVNTQAARADAITAAVNSLVIV